MDSLENENGIRSLSRTSLNIKIPIGAVSNSEPHFTPLNTAKTTETDYLIHANTDINVPNNTSRTLHSSQETQKQNISQQSYLELNSNSRPNSHLALEKVDKYYSTDSKQLKNSEKSQVLETMYIDRRDQHKRAVLIIEKTWISYRNKQMFRLLKHSVCAAENSLSYEILRKVSPKEAEFFNDKYQQIRLRFRFGGEEFPPMIFFKIFIHTGVQKVKYISGRKMIKPISEASADALKQMGNRTFYSQMMQDTIRQQTHPVTDEVDVTTLKDYMQYLSNLDESPANQGGKDNYWRKLTLDVLPRHTIFFDVVDFAYNNHLSPTLKEEMQILTARPVSQMMLVKQLKTIAKIRSHENKASTQYFKSSRSTIFRDLTQTSGRQTKQAREKAKKMRQLYSQQYNKEMDGVPSDAQDDDYLQYGEDVENKLLAEVSDEEWDEEAHQLYQWTQGLSFSEDLIHSPLVTF
ncbi:putative protein CXorf58 [Bulinus truncatus]|nr:putative protein CXorf58 [Bulinus truncatus]